MSNLPPSASHHPLSHLSSWRAKLLRVSQSLQRPLLFAFGWVSVDVIGTPASPTEAPILVVAPHSTLLDWAPLLWTNWASFVTELENKKFIIVGPMLEALQSIWVDRFVKDSKKQALDEIKRRVTQNMAVAAHTSSSTRKSAKFGLAGAEDEVWPQILMFPEGTTSNGSCLITFKPGAFVPGVPVQPVAIKFSADGFSAGWVSDGAPIWKLMLAMLSQWNGKVRVCFLPVHVPTEEEKADAGLFAEAVRGEIAAVLGIPLTEYTVEEHRLMDEAPKFKLPPRAAMAELGKVLRVVEEAEKTKRGEAKAKRGAPDIRELKKYLAMFARVNASLSGKTSREEWGVYFGESGSTDKDIHDLFMLFNTEKDGFIDFGQFLVGLYLHVLPAIEDEEANIAILRLTAKLMGSEDPVMRKVLKNLGASEKKEDENGDKADMNEKNGNGDSVSEEQRRLEKWLAENPLYAKLVTMKISSLL